MEIMRGLEKLLQNHGSLLRPNLRYLVSLERCLAGQNPDEMEMEMRIKTKISRALALMEMLMRIVGSSQSSVEAEVAQWPASLCQAQILLEFTSGALNNEAHSLVKDATHAPPLFDKEDPHAPYPFSIFSWEFDSACGPLNSSSDTELSSGSVRADEATRNWFVIGRQVLGALWP